MKYLLSLLMLVFPLYGRMINPITDVCWECIFPITLGGTPNKKDFSSYNTPICMCAGVPPKIGIPITFWEPVRMVDVTREAYKLVGLGGIKIGRSHIKNRGSVSLVAETPSHTSFHHVHYYVYPILALLGLLMDFECIEGGKLDVAYMSEFDPLWGDTTCRTFLTLKLHYFRILLFKGIFACSSSRRTNPIG